MRTASGGVKRDRRSILSAMERLRGGRLDD
jgi:hypothetical protein